MTATHAPEGYHDERQLAVIRLAQEHERLKALHALKKRRNFFLNLSGVSLMRATAKGSRGAAWLARKDDDQALTQFRAAWNAQRRINEVRKTIAHEEPLALWRI